MSPFTWRRVVLASILLSVRAVFAGNHTDPDDFDVDATSSKKANDTDINEPAMVNFMHHPFPYGHHMPMPMNTALMRTPVDDGYFSPYGLPQPPPPLPPHAMYALPSQSGPPPTHHSPPPHHPQPHPMPYPPPQMHPHMTHDRMSYIPFIGYVDPLIVIAIIALPVLGTLGVTSLLMPLIPIAIYLLNLFFPAGSGRKRRRRRHSPSARPLLDPLRRRVDHYVDILERALDRLAR